MVGIDEVGRGCWAGPLVAGAVILGEPIAGLRDSKKLSKSRREQLARQVNAQALAVGLGWVSSQKIDVIGLTEAVRLAMRRAMQAINKTALNYDEIIIDGNYNYLSDLCLCKAKACSRVRAMVRADDLVPAVSAASIVAKVARDNWMAGEVAQKFPQYYFDKHVGYGTKLHHEMLKTHGACELHRRSFKPVKLIQNLG